eukprot:CAMPEP_0115481302 /NCGR_PEP_ID=MMETSP0271-20121206/57726_1 /TAXON_ID=71861 /ORGANISM="Scrippsiella trochoidea, Strain CCMP3099" /LENGTH=129 /DNA_ID=CAMNT_0002909029 /DNA_START=76 /DNA_END=464 /DNA_ORIENTATION=-
MRSLIRQAEGANSASFGGLRGVCLMLATGAARGAAAAAEAAAAAAAAAAGAVTSSFNATGLPRGTEPDGSPPRATCNGNTKGSAQSWPAPTAWFRLSGESSNRSEERAMSCGFAAGTAAAAAAAATAAA